jgi:hypothetical protein
LRDETLGQLHMTVRREVHREERDVRADISAAEALAELDAIDDRDAAFLADIDVIEPEVAMAFADESLLATPVEHASARIQEVELKTLDLVRLGVREVTFLRGVDLGEVLGHVACDGLDRAPRRGHLVGTNPRMKIGEKHGEPIYVLRIEGACRESLIRAQRIRQAEHVYRPVHDLAFRAEMVATGRIDADRHEAEIRPDREPAIEDQLGFAGLLPRAERPEIEKPERHSLLHFVDVARGHEDTRDMGLAHLDALRLRGRIRLRPLEICLQIAAPTRSRLGSPLAPVSRGEPHGHAVAFARSASASVAVDIRARESAVRLTWSSIGVFLSRCKRAASVTPRRGRSEPGPETRERPPRRRCR